MADILHSRFGGILSIGTHMYLYTTPKDDYWTLLFTISLDISTLYLNGFSFASLLCFDMLRHTDCLLDYWYPRFDFLNVSVYRRSYTRTCSIGCLASRRTAEVTRHPRFLLFKKWVLWDTFARLSPFGPSKLRSLKSMWICLFLWIPFLVLLMKGQAEIPGKM